MYLFLLVYKAFKDTVPVCFSCSLDVFFGNKKIKFSEKHPVEFNKTISRARNGYRSTTSYSKSFNLPLKGSCLAYTIIVFFAQCLCAPICFHRFECNSLRLHLYKILDDRRQLSKPV